MKAAKAVTAFGFTLKTTLEKTPALRSKYSRSYSDQRYSDIIKSALQSPILAETRAGQGSISAGTEVNFLGVNHRPSILHGLPQKMLPSASPTAGDLVRRPRGGVGGREGQSPTPVTHPDQELWEQWSNYPRGPHQLGRPPAAPRASRQQGCSQSRSPARVVSVRSWLAAPRGNSLSFRPLRLSTPVTAASSSARSRERLHEPGPGPGPTPELEPQLTPERLPPDATGPEYSAAVPTATKPAAAISQTTTRPTGSAHAQPDLMVGRGKKFIDPRRFPWWIRLWCPSMHLGACLHSLLFQRKIKQKSGAATAPLGSRYILKMPLQKYLSDNTPHQLSSLSTRRVRVSIKSRLLNTCCLKLWLGCDVKHCPTCYSVNQMIQMETCACIHYYCLMEK